MTNLRERLEAAAGPPVAPDMDAIVRRVEQRRLRHRVGIVVSTSVVGLGVIAGAVVFARRRLVLDPTDQPGEHRRCAPTARTDRG